MRNAADRGERYPLRPKDKVDYTTRDLQIRILHILRKPNSLIAEYVATFTVPQGQKQVDKTWIDQRPSDHFLCRIPNLLSLVSHNC